MDKVLLLLFLASRTIFANPGNVFFDSKEYLTRWAEPNLWTALTTGHTPLHDGYILTFWPVFHLAGWLTSHPEYVVILTQILMSLGVVVFFYKTVRILFSRSIALKSAILLSLAPLFWVTNGSVMMETTYLFYWMASIYFLLIYLRGKGGVKNLFYSAVLWAMAFLTHTVVILWLPFILYLVWSVDARKFGRVFWTGLLTLAGVSLLNAFLLGKAVGQGLTHGFYELYFAKFGEHAQVTSGLLTIFRYLRNWIVPTFYNNNGLLVVFSAIGFFHLFKQNKKYAILFFLWIIPTLMTNQWWDSLFYGRHALISVFALCILAALATKKWTLLLLVSYLTFCSFSSLTLMKSDVPYLSMQEKINRLQPGGLLIESHFARPQTSGEYFGEVFYVGEPGYDENKLTGIIAGYTEKNKPVFITGQALSEPYGLFNGPYLHSLTLSYKQPFILKEILGKYSFEELNSVDKNNNLIIFHLEEKPGVYPEIKNLIKSDRRLDRADVVSKAVLSLFSSK